MMLNKFQFMNIIYIEITEDVKFAQFCDCVHKYDIDPLDKGKKTSDIINRSICKSPKMTQNPTRSMTL